MLWLSGRKSCDLSSQGFVMVPGEAEGERDSHMEGEKGKTDDDASKSFLYNFFSSTLFWRKWRTAHR